MKYKLLMLAILVFTITTFMLTSNIAVAGVDKTQINMVAGLDLANTIQNETCLIQNKPFDANNIVICTNDDSDANGSVGPDLGCCYSLDGGATWRHSHIQNMPGAMTFDPSVAADTNGNLYSVCVNDVTPFWQPPCAIWIHESTDKGATWAGGYQIRAFSSTGSPPVTNRYLDKSWITVDTYSNSPNTNNIYVAWQEDDLVSNKVSWIYLVKMTPADVAAGIVRTPVQVTETTRMSPYDNGPVPAVAPNGDLYVVWLDTDITISSGQQPGKIRLRKSTDAGSTWSPTNSSTIIANLTTVPKYYLSGSGTYRQTSFPSIACDPTNSSNVYVVYAADPDGASGSDNGNIYFSRSTDGGSTWSTPTVINDDTGINDQFQPWIDVKSNGYIDIVWLDGRNCPSMPYSTPPDWSFDVYMATSIDSGQTFQANQRVSDQRFDVFNGVQNSWIGEYIGLDVDSTTAYISWTGVTWGGPTGDPDINFDTMPNPNNTTTTTGVVNMNNATITAAFSSVINPGITSAAVTGVPVYAVPVGRSFISAALTRAGAAAAEVNSDTYHGYFDVSTTAGYSGPIEITYKYDESIVGAENESQLKLYHYSTGGWHECTTELNTSNNTITGSVDSLSVFALTLPASSTSGPAIATGYNTIWFALISLITLLIGLILLRRVAVR